MNISAYEAFQYQHCPTFQNAKSKSDVKARGMSCYDGE